MTQSQPKYRPSRRSVIAAVLALLVLLPAWWWTGLWQQERLITEKRLQISDLLKVQGQSLGKQVNSRLSILKALKIFIEERIGADHGIAQAEFAAFGAGLKSGTTGIRSLSIAPDGVTRFVFPSANNEWMIGQDLINGQIRADVQRTIRTHRIAVGGPYKVRSGGLELVGRQAVFAKDQLWGLVSVDLDLGPVFTEAGLEEKLRDLQIALMDRSGHLLFGEKSALSGNPVFGEVDLPDGDWKLAALPAGGWIAAAEESLLLFKGMTLAMAILLSLLIGVAVGYQAHVAMAVSRRTGVLQRSLTDRREVEEQLSRTLVSLRQAIGTTLSVLGQAVEIKDPSKTGHHKRVADLARAIATEMGYPEETIDGIRMAATLHDIGKIPLPAEMLSRAVKLSDTESSLMKTHVQTGYDILNDIEFPWPVAKIVYQHHERMDGSGYPLGLKGEQILPEARVLAVADVVEAMASPRFYRPTSGLDEALREIEKQRGVLYDVGVVDACLRIFREKDFRLA
jgi:putative nucleotidyltransferase with HDIG domain